MANWRLETTDFAVIRTPYLPADALAQVHALNAADGREAEIKSALAAMQALCSRPDIVQAIEFASESLAANIDKLTTSLDAQNLKLAASIYKYLVRMSTRSTPFAAFSSVMPVSMGDDSRLSIGQDLNLYTRLDSSCVARLARLAEQHALARENPHLELRVNTNLYSLENEHRMISSHDTDDRRDYSLESIQRGPLIDAVVELASDWIEWGALMAALQSEYFADADTASLRGFIRELLDCQVLHSKLTLVVGSRNSLDALIHRMERARCDGALIAQYREISTLLSSNQRLSDAQMNSRLSQAKDKLLALLPDETFKKWLHVDAFRPADQNALANAQLQPVMDVVNRLAPLFWQSSQVMDEFKQAFKARYDDASVPLMQALDVENGIPFGPQRSGRSPLLNGVRSAQYKTQSKINWSGLDTHLLIQIVNGVERGDKVIELNLDELERFYTEKSKPAPSVNDSYALHGTLLRDENAQPLFHLMSMGGPSALALLGRFCCGDADLLQRCQSLAKAEQLNSGGGIKAEIIHAQQYNTANISARPALRPMEIVYGPGDSDSDNAQQIHARDLYLKCENDELMLFSKRHNVRIYPRLSSAHNTRGLNLPVYQFLAAMQFSDGFFLPLRLNQVTESLPYIPEIRIESLVLSLPQWLISKREVHTLRTAEGVVQKLQRLEELREQRGLPDLLAIREGDNVLEFDLRSAFSAMMFAHELVKRHTSVRVIESTHGRTDPGIRGEAGRYRHEMILPMLNRAARTDELSAGIGFRVPREIAVHDLTSLPNEHWKYLKLYTGAATADRLLAQHLAPLANELQQQGLIADWFFIRYNDPDFHLRLRFRLRQNFSTDAVNAQLYPRIKKLTQSGLIQRVVEDSHVPEVERYGGRHILPVCEQLFHCNSVVVSNFIAAVSTHPDPDRVRWQMALNLAWRAAYNVFHSVADMESYFKRVAAAYDREFGFDEFTKRKVNMDYRQRMPWVEQALSPEFTARHVPDHCNEVLASSAAAYAELLDRCETLNRQPAVILQSLIHMDCNRIFVLQQRANEWILYHYLAKYARTVLARKFTPGKEVIGGA